MAQLEFNVVNVINAAQMLQPVSPFDQHYQAQWYNEGFGKQIMNAQITTIEAWKSLFLKRGQQLVKSELGVILNNVYPDWPKPPYKERGFWTRGHGVHIIQEWDAMVGRFVDVINAMR